MAVRSRSVPATILVTLALLPGCGGGGGGNTSPAPAPQPPSPLAAPQNVQVASGNAAATLSWDAVPGAQTYNLYRATNSGLTKSNYASLPGGTKLAGQTSPALVTSLTNGTTYYFLVTATKGSPVTEESPESALVSTTPTAPPQPGDPTPVTSPATSVSGTTANLNGSFTNPAGYTTTAWFEYGPTATYGSVTASDAFLLAGPVSFSKPVAGLPPWSTTHFRLVAQNTGGIFHGSDLTLTTLREPAVLLTDLDAPTTPVFDGTYIYWLEVYGARVRRFNINDGTTSTLADVAVGGNAGLIALDASYIYFAGTDAGIRRMALDGSNLDNTFCTLAAVWQIVTHPTGLYVREEWVEPAPTLAIHHYISRISLDGQTKTRLYERTGGGSSGFGGGLAVDGSDVYFADYFQGSVQKMPLSGGTPVFLATGLGHPDSFILDGSDLYVSCDEGIKKINVTTGVASTVFSFNGPSSSLFMAKEGGTLYISGSSLGKIDLATGTLTLLSNQPGGGSTPIVTPSQIYWISGGNHYAPPLGTLSRIPKN